MVVACAGFACSQRCSELVPHINSGGLAGVTDPSSGCCCRACDAASAAPPRSWLTAAPVLPPQWPDCRKPSGVVLVGKTAGGGDAVLMPAGARRGGSTGRHCVIAGRELSVREGRNTIVTGAGGVGCPWCCWGASPPDVVFVNSAMREAVGEALAGANVVRRGVAGRERGVGAAGVSGAG